MIRVVLPYHLRNLARIHSEVNINIEGPATIGAVIDALEAAYPMLKGTIRDQVTMERRPFIRFFACGEDLSLESSGFPLPDPIVTGAEPFRVVGAMSGG
jgi:hypothetical protein